MNKRKKLKDNLYLQLFYEFFKLGMFTIGGGMAMIPLIQNIVVDQKRWLSEEEAVDCIAVSQGLPGVIAINMATYIGRKKKGLPGSLCATAGVILPSFIIIILIVELLDGIGDAAWLNGTLQGIKAAATGLIAYSAYKMGKKVLTGPFQWILAVGSFIAIAAFGINAVWTIIAGMLLGILFTSKNKKTETERSGEEK